MSCESLRNVELYLLVNEKLNICSTKKRTVLHLKTLTKFSLKTMLISLHKAFPRTGLFLRNLLVNPADGKDSTASHLLRTTHSSQALLNL